MADKKTKTTPRFRVPSTSGWKFMVPPSENIYQNTTRICLADITRHSWLCHNCHQNLGKIIPNSLTSRCCGNIPNHSVLCQHHDDQLGIIIPSRLSSTSCELMRCHSRLCHNHPEHLGNVVPSSLTSRTCTLMRSQSPLCHPDSCRKTRAKSPSRISLWHPQRFYNIPYDTHKIFTISTSNPCGYCKKSRGCHRGYWTKIWWVS